MPKPALTVLVQWNWLLQLGAFGLIVIVIIDQSFVPIPGGIDMLLILLTAGRPQLWWLYWSMALAGALLGAYITYMISKKGGKEALKKKLPRRHIEKVEKGFAKGGFVGLFVAGLLPPPLPMVPVVVGAGALQYPTRKFLLAVGSS